MIRGIKQQKKAEKRRGQRITKKLNKWCLTVIGINILYMTFTLDTTVGYNKYYIPVVILSPAIIGTFLIIKFGGPLFIIRNRNEERMLMSIWTKIMIVIFAFLISLFSFGLTASSVFDIANKITSRLGRRKR